jgi:hypothetical protein
VTKVVDPDLARSIMSSGKTLPTWPELIDLDTTVCHQRRPLLG